MSDSRTSPRHLERGGKAADRQPRRKVRWLPRAMLHLSLPASPSFAYVSEGQTARNEGADETRDRGSTTDFLQPMTTHVPARRDVHQPRHCCDQDVGMRLRLSSRSPAHQCHSGLLPTATSLSLSLSYSFSLSSLSIPIPPGPGQPGGAISAFRPSLLSCCILTCRIPLLYSATGRLNYPHAPFKFISTRCLSSRTLSFTNFPQQGT